MADSCLAHRSHNQQLKLGEQAVHLFTVNGNDMARSLREGGYRVTQFEGSGRDGRVDLLFIQVARKHVHRVSMMARQLDPGCFYVVDDVRAAQLARG